MSRLRHNKCGCHRLVPKTCHQHVTGPLAHGISLQGGELTRIAVDLVGGETARLRAGSEEEFALRVQAKGAGYSFSRHLPNGRQPPVSVNGEPRDAIVSTVRNIQELPRSGHLNLGAGVPSGVTVGQSGYSLKCR